MAEWTLTRHRNAREMLPDPARLAHMHSALNGALDEIERLGRLLENSDRAAGLLAASVDYHASRSQWVEAHEHPWSPLPGPPVPEVSSGATTWVRGQAPALGDSGAPYVRCATCTQAATVLWYRGTVGAFPCTARCDSPGCDPNLETTKLPGTLLDRVTKWANERGGDRLHPDDPACEYCPTCGSDYCGGCDDEDRVELVHAGSRAGKTIREAPYDFQPAAADAETAMRDIGRALGTRIDLLQSAMGVMSARIGRIDSFTDGLAKELDAVRAQDNVTPMKRRE